MSGKHTFKITALTALCSLSLQYGFSQENVNKALVTLHSAAGSLRSVLTEFSGQTGIKFVYYDDLVEGRIITASVTNKPFDAALEEILAQASLSYKLMTGETAVLYSPESSHDFDRIPSGERFRANIMKPPVLQEDVIPYYPPEAQARGWEGRVGVYLLVAKDGRVKQARVAESSGYRILDDAAMESALDYRFKPAMQGDKAVDVWISWTLDFQLEKRQLLPVNYVQQVRLLRKQAEKAPPERKPSLYWELLRTYDEYTAYFYTRGDISDNKITRLIISEDTYEEWREWWNTIPLQFLVFDDFIRKHPRSGYVSFAATKLNHYVNLLVSKLREESRKYPETEDIHNRFIDRVRAFLRNDYNQTVEDSLLRG